MTEVELLAFIEVCGGRVWLKDGKLKSRLPKHRSDLREIVAANKQLLANCLETTDPRDLQDAVLGQPTRPARWTGRG